MDDTFQTMYYLTRNSERIAEMLAGDADVDVIKLSAALANMLQKTWIRDHQLLRQVRSVTAKDQAGA
jgi:hypothetical protein